MLVETACSEPVSSQSAVLACSAEVMLRLLSAVADFGGAHLAAVARLLAGRGGGVHISLLPNTAGLIIDGLHSRTDGVRACILKCVRQRSVDSNGSYGIDQMAAHGHG